MNSDEWKTWRWYLVEFRDSCWGLNTLKCYADTCGLVWMCICDFLVHFIRNSKR